ncbi:inositol-trisphosphate 3-kinase A isoform X2 [Microplitis demolitor]|uniref:inositol-trisphosphate 3-kinase A isoform X2 n=1 Tax=Microplitis demolitor TaxID=69319 RepID=UPI00235B6837|nr:inositol-trisphosphate 3-kinase A isoform X2 [Microplitis demolitor]
MQDTCGMMIPTIVYTKPSLSDCSYDEDKSNGSAAGSESSKKFVRHRRPSRSRVRRNSRRLSISRDEYSSSSSRSPSPSTNHYFNESLIKFAGDVNLGDDEDVDGKNKSDIKNNSTGYGQYLQLLQVPQINSLNLEWGEPSGDDLSSEWESDYSEGQHIQIIDTNHTLPKSSAWKKLKNIIQWAPFFQTYKKKSYPWIQLAGHQGNFRAGPTPGTILKKLCLQEEACFRLLMNDVLRPYVPEFKGVLDVREEEGHQNQESDVKSPDDTTCNSNSVVTSYLQLQDLLGDFEDPCVMDCKVGVRTYLESELAKAKEHPKLRKDMYEKMIQIDPTAPSLEEKRLQGVTKPRYMVWRETISSTATLGFRVEGVKLTHGSSSKDFKTTKTREQVTEALKYFVENHPHAVPKYLQRLKAIRATLKTSPFFATHEIVGSSLLFVHDSKNAGVWMIDFAKTLPLPSTMPSIRHDAEWEVGNHEDGYLIGVNNLIDIFEDIKNSEKL